jgi:hypothetical protein
MSKKLFTIKSATAKRATADTPRFGSKHEAKQHRNEVNETQGNDFVVTIAEDHRRFKG